MNRIFSFFSLQFILLILITILTAKLITLIILYFIDAKPINEYKISQTPIYQYYRFDKIFEKKENKINKTSIIKNENPNILKRAKLTATYEDGLNSIAMINYKHKTYVLKINDLFQGYKIVKIYSDRIFLEKNKNLYMLALKGIKLPKIKKTIQHKQASNQDNFIAITKEKIAHFQKNFQDIWQNIGIQEIYKYGRLQGYKVTFIRKNSYFEHIGLKVGDIITKINDKRLKSNADAFYFYKNIDKFDSLKLTVIRDHKEINLEFALE